MGVVEQKHQHILSITHALKFQSELSNEFFLGRGGGLCDACSLSNKSILSPVLKEHTPYEILFGKAPTYHHLKAFGCLYFAGVPVETRHKFDSKAIKCVFNGFKSGVKGCKFLNIQTKQVFVSRDVQFYETHFL